MVVKFSEIYGELICNDVPKKMLKSKENRSGYLSEESVPSIPDEYRNEIAYHPDGFIVNYCEEY